MVGINTNISAYFAQGSLSKSNEASTLSIGRLSSGNRIIRAADDVAGLSVGTILRTTVNTLKTALSNTQQANSLLSVADGGLKNIGEILQRQKSLAVQATAGTLSAAERGFLNQEFQNLTQEIDRLVENTKFNAVTLLNGSIYDAANLRNRNAFEDAAGTYEYTTSVELREGVITVELDAGLIAATTDIVVNTVLTNEAFVGDLGGAKFKAEYLSTNNLQLSITVGELTYSGTLDAAAGGAVTFTALDALGQPVTSNSGGTESFAITFAAGNSNNSQIEADQIASRLNTYFSKVQFYQERTLNLDIGGVLAGGEVTATLANFKDVRVEDINVEAQITGSRALKAQIVLNGEVFEFEHTANNETDFTNVLTATTTFTSLKDPNKELILDLQGVAFDSAAFDPNNTTDVQKFEDALKAMFRMGTGESALVFQTGNSVSDNIEVQVKSVSSAAIGIQGLDVLNVVNAQKASAALDLALNYITAIRADVGALQSRFDYAAANLETTIQNTDAAKSTFLDADISEESTSYATAQVTLQASISVLAQANQLPQNLLKLIG